jgi:hypothetical protein
VKKYNVTPHAIKRAVERLGVDEDHAINYINQLMQTAYYNGDSTSKYGITRVYDHYKTRTRIIVGKDDRVITIYRIQEELNVSELPAYFRDKLKVLFKKEHDNIELMERKVERRNTLTIAEIKVELAELNLRLLRARSKSTINAINARVKSLEIAIDERNKEVNKIKRDKEIISKAATNYA